MQTMEGDRIITSLKSGRSWKTLPKSVEVSNEVIHYRVVAMNSVAQFVELLAASATHC